MIPVTRTSLDLQWRRVIDSAVSARDTRALLDRPLRKSRDLAKDAAKVNAWVNSHVAYVSDQALYGKADYWAPAKTTLSIRRGDCEDFAILKMQMLRALGFDGQDMYLTIARDLARQEDHAVLIVRVGDQKLVLDNATSQIIDATQTNDYRPVLSFTSKHKWLHGY